MKKIKSLVSISLLTASIFPTSFAFAADQQEQSVTAAVASSSLDAPAVNEQFFDQQKKVVIEEVTNGSSSSQSSAANQLQNADYVYMSETGQVYSSQRGYLGAAKKDKDEDTVDNSRSVTQFNPNNQIPVKEINGGTTGAFERRQLDYQGFDTITSDITLPAVSGLGEGEQPWVYYGFDSLSGKSVEGGYAYQTGTHRWLPYIRSNGFYYGDSANQKYDNNQIKNVKFYLAKTATSDTYYNAYFVVDNSQILIAPTKWTDSDAHSTSVKRVTSIAKKAFDGSNIIGRTDNQRYENVQVSRFYEEQAYPWSQYTEYTENRSGKWYGTMDTTPSYVHRDWLSTSIYNGKN